MGKIIASCHHDVADMDDVIEVEYPETVCDAVDGFKQVTVFASFCRNCANKINELNGKIIFDLKKQ